MSGLMFWKEPPPFAPWGAPDWAKATAEACVEQTRQYVERQLHFEIDWYRRNIGWRRRFSQAFRALAIVLTTLGGLVPVLHSAGVLALLEPEPAPAGLELGQLGYVLLAMAGGFALFDRFFGFSTAWMRYVAAMCALERVRELFRLEWVALSRPRAGMTVDEAHGRLLELAKRSLLKAKELTERETEAWITEFKANLAQLEKDLRAQVEAGRPGAIDVKVKDGDKASDGFELRLDQLLVEHVTGSTASIASVPPGLHKVSAAAALAGKTYLASQIVNVVPAEIVAVELELRIQ
jgi:hypothetical protein